MLYLSGISYFLLMIGVLIMSNLFGIFGFIISIGVAALLFYNEKEKATHNIK